VGALSRENHALGFTGVAGPFSDFLCVSAPLRDEKVFRFFGFPCVLASPRE